MAGTTKKGYRVSKKTDWTLAERQERIAERAARKSRIADGIENLRDWRHQRSQAAAKAAKKRAKKLRKQPRGIDRVPAHLWGLAPTVEPVLTGKRGTALAQAEDLHPSGNHATRRARGQRGKQRPRRLREMPGAEARRIERNRKAWSA